MRDPALYRVACVDKLRNSERALALDHETQSLLMATIDADDYSSCKATQ